MAKYPGLDASESSSLVKINNKIRSNAKRARGLTGRTRREQKRLEKLGVIPGSEMAGVMKVRKIELDVYDKYVANEQYDGLQPWDAGDDDCYIPIRDRKPRIIVNTGKRVVNTLAAKLCGESVFPRMSIEDDPDAEQFIQVLGKVANLPVHILMSIKKALACGSNLLRYYITGSTLHLESYDSKYCYPEFDDENHLVSVEIRYVYEDDADRDSQGKAREKWFRMELGREVDVLYDNPYYSEGGQLPVFDIVEEVQHGMGYVQAQWFKTGYDKHSPDGPSVLCDALDLIDAINYSLSQSDRAVNYAQEPQLTIKGVDVEDVDELVRSSSKAWNMGREGEAKFIEADLGGVEKAGELRDKMKQHMTDITRVVLLDPEKIVGSAQSAKAMEVLHGPLLEIVGELRQILGPQIVELYTKIAVTIIALNQRGENTVMAMPSGWVPKSLALNPVWPPVFPMTMEDLQKKAAVGISVANASILSRESITKWLAKDFGVEDLEEELNKVNTQKELNAFGGF